VATLTAAVGQIVRQGGHETERILALSAVVHELAVVDPERWSGRTGRRTFVRAAESAHGASLTTSMQTHTHNTSHFMQLPLDHRFFNRCNVALNDTVKIGNLTLKMQYKQMEILAQVCKGTERTTLQTQKQISMNAANFYYPEVCNEPSERLC
jgi:hypothetical protein